jgi:hypothetical protein
MKLSNDIGEDFPLTVELVDAQTRSREAKIRGYVALVIVIFSTAVMASAAVLGVVDGTFNELEAVWIAAAPLIGAVANHYLGRKHE